MRYYKVKSWLHKGLYNKTGRILTALVLIASNGAVLLGTSQASAAGKTAYVGHGNVGNDTGCGSPGYSSVQAAVDASSAGGTVYLCGAPFAEQVFVSKNLTLEGSNTSGLTGVGATFTTSTTRYPAKFASDNLAVPQALLVETGANTKLQVNDLTFNGPMPGNGGCAEDEYGVLALGGNLTMSNDKVLNIADSSTSLYGCQFGVAIQVGRKYWPTADFSSDTVENFKAVASLSAVTVSGYQKNGITVDGPGSEGTITTSDVTGGGPGAPFGTIIAQNGIQISRGATGSVSRSNIADNAYSGTGYASSTGVLLFGGCGDPLVTGIDVYNDGFTGNDVAISFANYNASCTAPPSAATKDQAYNDTMSNSAVTNVSGLCDGSVSCGGSLIGYQAGVEDVGNGDSVFNIKATGAGYTNEGTYNYKVNPPVFTKTGPDNAFVRDVDAGASFPTLNAKVFNVSD